MAFEQSREKIGNGLVQFGEVLQEEAPAHQSRLNPYHQKNRDASEVLIATGKMLQWMGNKLIPASEVGEGYQH